MPQVLADVVTYAYIFVGFASIGFQLVRRFGWKGPLWTVPALVPAMIGLGLRATFQSFAPLVFAAMAGAFCLSIVLVTRGRLERFPDRDLLPEALRATTSDEETGSMQMKVVGLALLLMVPVVLVNWQRL